jgi:hypothetical protein
MSVNTTDATTTQKGIVQLNDTLTSSSTAEALTAAQGKVLRDTILNLDTSDPTASGTATSFIDSISQTDGKLSATKKTVPDATTTQKGIVQLNNSLTSSSTTEALTAAQGKALKDAIDSKTIADATTTQAGLVKLTTNGWGLSNADGTVRTVPAAAGTQGTIALPNPASTKTYLRGDGKWDTPPDTNRSWYSFLKISQGKLFIETKDSSTASSGYAGEVTLPVPSTVDHAISADSATSASSATSAGSAGTLTNGSRILQNLNANTLASAPARARILPFYNTSGQNQVLVAGQKQDSTHIFIYTIGAASIEGDTLSRVEVITLSDFNSRFGGGYIWA